MRTIATEEWESGSSDDYEDYSEGSKDLSGDENKDLEVVRMKHLKETKMSMISSIA